MIFRQDPPHLLTVVDLFAGCGGLSLGLEYAGFTPVFVSEINEDARATYVRNRPSHDWLRGNEFITGDVRELIRNSSYSLGLRKRLRAAHGIGDGELDLVVGGPPCQGFSGIGIRRSFPVWKRHIESNYLFDHMAKVIFELRPRVFLFENVRGLLSARWEPRSPKGEIWETVFNTFSSLPGYQVSAALVHAKDYGVPQNRPRVLLVGVRDDIWSPEPVSADVRSGGVELGFLPRGKERAPDLSELLGDLEERVPANGGALNDYPRPAQSEWQRWFRATPPEGLGAGFAAPFLTDHKFSKHSDRVLRKFALMHANGGAIPLRYRTAKFAQRLLPSRWDETTGPTITATSLPDDFVHYSRPRTLTVREWARLQTFPDWYEFCGKRTTGGRRRAGNPQAGENHRDLPKYTQIGNAVAVKLAYEVGLHFRKTFFEKPARATPATAKQTAA